ncbi:hypothetical protein [Agaribacterium sp. ZY112]|uniref:hypothetical protein n=1 Tax=Agaribacterium sp. ZY112 TaxID=3233574 RepID=UPI0035241014
MAKLLRLFKNISYILLALALLFAGAWFASENPQHISLVLFGIPLPTLSIGLYFCASFALGVLVTFCINFVVYQRRILALRAEIRSLKKVVQKNSNHEQAKNKALNRFEPAKEDKSRFEQQTEQSSSS